MTDMKNIRLTWDPYGGRMAGLRSNDTGTTKTLGIREYGATMDGAGNVGFHAGRGMRNTRAGEGPAVWDDFTPMLNPRWDGKKSPTHAGRGHRGTPPTNISSAVIFTSPPIITRASG